MQHHDLPWLEEYKVFGIPETLKPYPDKPVYDLLDKTAEIYKTQGVIQFNYLMTYPEVKDHADRLATALHNKGLKKGDRVATILPTSIQFIIADYGISKAGLVHISASSLESVKTLAHKFSEASPKALICLDEDLDLARELLKTTDVAHLILCKLLDYSLNPPSNHEESGMPGTEWLTDIIKHTPPDPPLIPFDAEKDLEMILFTGGTTGLPKGCMLTHQNIYANALQGAYAFGRITLLWKGAVSVLLGVPFFHSYGHSIMHTITYMGCNQILIPDARDTKSMVEMIKTYHPILQFGVPTQFMNMAKDKLGNIGILAISGSAPLPPEIQKQFEEKSSGGIMEGYGLSEMSPVTHFNTSLLLRITGGRTGTKMTNKLLQFPGVTPVVNRFLRSIGPKRVGWAVSRLISLLLKFTAKKSPFSGKSEKRGTTGIPCPDTEIKFIDVTSGEKLSIKDMLSGHRGEMCLKGPQRMLGYWPQPGSGLDDEGYVRTSDVVEVDDRGYFSIVDRTKDMIIVSGYKVYSRELDDILLSHPAVELAATVGVPDPEREGSERVAVYVKPKAEYRHRLTEDEIIEYLKETVAKYAVPKFVRIVDELPLTEVQKLNKKEVRRMAAEAFS